MRVFENVRLVGNFNRLREMKRENFSNQKMSNIFKSNDININPDQIDFLLFIDKEFTTKSVTKKSVKEAKESSLNTLIII